MKEIVPPGRVVGLDIARCVALIGMFATHVLDTTGEDGVTIVQQLAGGRASGLFAVLAGVSLALMSGRSTPFSGAERTAVSSGLAVRALLIAFVGLLLGSLETTIAVILTYYGLLFLLGLPFLGLRARSLALLSGAWLVVVPVLSHLLRPFLPGPSYATPNFDSLVAPWQLLTELTFTGYYPVVPWLAYLLAGMAIGRLNLSRWSTTVGLVVVGGSLAAVSWAGSRILLARPDAVSTLDETLTGPGRRGSLQDSLDHGLFGTTSTESWWWLAVEAPHTGTPFDLAHTIGTALLVIGISIALGRVLPRLTAVVFGAGAMTLTLYSLHVVLRTQTFWPDDNVETFIKHVALALAIGAVYRLLRKSGPLERLVAIFAKATANEVRAPSKVR